MAWTPKWYKTLSEVKTHYIVDVAETNGNILVYGTDTNYCYLAEVTPIITQLKMIKNIAIYQRL